MAKPGVTKWLWRLLLLLFLAVTTMGLWLPPILIRATEKEYHFPEVSIDATVQPNGDLVLEERRTFDFRNGPFTYAYFTVDDPYDHVRDFSMAEIVDGDEVPVTPDYASHSIVYDNFQAQWSYSANDENRTWVFRYRVACAVDAWADTAHLYWQFIGTGWERPTNHAVVTVHLPPHVQGTVPARPAECEPDVPSPPVGSGSPLARSEVRAWGHGPLNGQVTFADPQTIRYEVSDMPPASYLEGSIVFPADAVPAAVQQPEPRLQIILDQEQRWADQANALRERHERQRMWVFILMIGVVLVMPLLTLLAAVRDRIPEVPKYLEQPPEDDSVQGALLWSAWRGHLNPQNAYRAQVLRLVRLGAIQMQAEGTVSDPKDLTIVKVMDALDLPTQADQDFQMLLFGTGGDAVDHVSLRHPKPRPLGGAPYSRYQHWWQGVRNKSGETLKRIQKGDARLESTLAFLIAGGVAGYGIWTAVWGLGGRVGWLLVPVSALALIGALRAIPARVERPIRERIAKLAAFRRFLKSFSDLPNAPAMAVIIWDQYLEWAVALDVADEVEKQVKAVVPVEQLRSPIPGGPSGLQGLSLWHSMNAAVPGIVISSMASATPAGSSSGGFGSSSSSSGFSSGGFSGGGGGGGGGTGGGAG